MKIEEAIKFAKYATTLAKEPEVQEFYRMCEEALRAQAEAERNDPLTPEDLRGMGKKAYWHVGLQDGSPPPHWAILPDHIAMCPKDYFYGEYWLAYRYELKKG